MGSVEELEALVLDAWSTTAQYIASGHAAEFIGRYKERDVLRHLRGVVEAEAPALRVIGPDSQATFKGWRIDLVCVAMQNRLAIEAKFKTQRDGAVPDNRKAAFFDLFRLEQYVVSGECSAGFFLWLTDNDRYRSPATGDSADFSTHDGRLYRAGTQLRAARSRDASIPNPLVLGRSYQFQWRRVLPSSNWYSLALRVGDEAG